MEQVKPYDVFEYWQNQLVSARRAVEVAEEMVCFYAIKNLLRREIDHDLSQGLVHHINANGTDAHNTSPVAYP